MIFLLQNDQTFKDKLNKDDVEKKVFHINFINQINCIRILSLIKRVLRMNGRIRKEVFKYNRATCFFESFLGLSFWQ